MNLFDVHNISTVMISEDEKKVKFNIFYKSTKIAYCVKRFYNPVTLKKLATPTFELYHDYSDRLAANFPDDAKFKQSSMLYSIGDMMEFVVDLLEESE